eukprot:GFUD01114902.1.p1 GENE.GFUD01114902.1~~GFUD01114902.1.p1  ORF type:complete len:2510 (+),score=681.34 GFUD01114902.1:132-7661(+)
MMDGQQVFVTGADGEQMVLSGPEAAALLAQAGITLGDQDQVMIGGEGGQVLMGEGGEDGQQQMEEMVAEEGSILAPEGSTVGDDGSIIAADGTILAPPGTVMIGEDGTLMMAENSALLSQDGNFVGESEKGEGGEVMQGGNVFTTADGAILRAGEDNVLTDADGNVLTDQDGNILTTADIGALTQDGNIMAAEEETNLAEGGEIPMAVESDGNLSGQTGQEDILTTSDGNVITSDGNFLRTADGNILTDQDGNFLTSDGNIIKPEEAQKLLASQGVSLLESENKDEVIDGDTSELLQTENVVNEEIQNDVTEPESSDIAQEVEKLSTPANDANDQMLMDVAPPSQPEGSLDGDMQEITPAEPVKAIDPKAIVEEGASAIAEKEPFKAEADQLCDALMENSAPVCDGPIESGEQVVDAPMESDEQVGDAPMESDEQVGDALVNVEAKDNGLIESIPEGIALIEGETHLVGEEAMESMPTLDGVTDGKEMESADGTVATTAEGVVGPSAGSEVSSADGGEKPRKEAIAEATAVPSDIICTKPSAEVPILTSAGVSYTIPQASAEPSTSTEGVYTAAQVLAQTSADGTLTSAQSANITSAVGCNIIAETAMLNNADGVYSTAEPAYTTVEAALTSTEGAFSNQDLTNTTDNGTFTSAEALYTNADGTVTTADGLAYSEGELAIPTSSDGGIYTTSDGRVVSVPEGIMTNAAGNLLNPADGSILTTEDGTPLMLPEGAILKSVSVKDEQPTDSLLSTITSMSNQVQNYLPTSGHTTDQYGNLINSSGGIVVSAAEGGIMTTSDSSLVQNNQTGNILATADGSILTSEDGTMITAPEGSIIAADGSILAADGTMLAPPGSVITTDTNVLAQAAVPQQEIQQHQPAQATQPQHQNLIGLQLPDEGGEVLYLDPNDPAAQLLLQEAGIHLGEGGVLQTADGQILHSEDGNPITTNSRPNYGTSKTNNLVADAAAAAGLVTSEDLGFQLPTGVTPQQRVVDTSAIDIPLNANQAVNEIRPDLPVSSQSYNQSITEEPQRHLFQPRYSTQSSIPQQTYQQQQQPQAQAQQKYQKLTFNSAAAYNTPSPAPIQKKTVAPRQKKTVPSTDMQIGPDQQKVTYTVTSENGYSQTYMMICSKSLDQNTLINTLIKNISNDPNHKGKKTIKITQHKYGAKKQQKQTQQKSYGQQRQNLMPSQVVQQTRQPTPQRRITPQPQPRPQQTIQPQQMQYKPLPRPPSPQKIKPPSPIKPPQQILQSEPDMAEFPADNLGDNLSLDDIVNQMGGGTDDGTGQNDEPKVMVRCNYCTNFRSALNSQTWENILNHILPVAKEELHTSFYGNILKHFARSLRVSVSGRGTDQCEVIVSHGLVCRRTGAWYSVDRPGVELATTLASHIAAVQPGVAGPYGARPRGNSLICLFCCSPYTAEDYQRHLKPHQEFIIPCLLLAAGAYCATSFELDVRKSSVCGTCREGETQDLRFLPCTKFASDFNCGKRLQSTVDCFRENFDSRGFLQVSNSAMTKCSVCRTPNNTYCALFKPNAATMMIFGGNSEEMLSVCANCQKQFVNVVMRENSFEKQLKMFQLHHMEQLCGMLRVLLSASQAVCAGNYNLLYTVQEGGSLYSASNTLHSVMPAKLLLNPVLKSQKVEEDKSIDMSGTTLRYVCEQCKFSIDLTRLQHASGRNLSHLVDMAIGVVLEHIVPHTESLLSVIMTSAFNEIFSLKFEFAAHVEGEGPNKKISISLDRKIVASESVGEVVIQKDIYKTIEVLKAKIKQDKKGNVNVKRKHIFMDSFTPLDHQDMGQLVEVGRFLDQASPVLQLYGSSGCNTKLLDYYAECRLCSKFSFPDFRLTAAIRNRDGVALCENCCETILSLCVPSEPERIPGRGEVCLLLGVEKNTGHRLVLSNNSKKWISADGVEKIQAVSEVAASSAIPDYGTTLVQLLKSHLQAVAERAWSDTSCLTARAGFCVSDPSLDQTMLDEMTGQPKQAPIEVKVTIRPPKPKTPPPKLMITPVNARFGNQKMVKPQVPSPSTASKLVKITANRRIIPVRDPTSISAPPRIPKTIAKSDVETKAKIAALRESLKANAKLNDSESSKMTPKLPKNTTISQAKPTIITNSKAIPDDEDIDSDLEKEGGFESIDAIADFINNSEPPQKPVNPSNSDLRVTMTSLEDHELCDVTDEFTDTALNTPKPQKPLVLENELNTPEVPAKTEIKLPKGTVVTNVASPDSKPNVPYETEPIEKIETEDLKLPPGLKISMAPAGMVKIQAGVTKPDPKVIELGPKVEIPSPKTPINNKNVIELGNPKTETLPSPASDATTSTKDTVTPNSLTISKTKKPFMPRLLPRQETPQQPDKAQKDEKTSTVKQQPKKIETPKNRLPKKETELSDHEIEHLTSLDLDLDVESDEESTNELSGVLKKSPMKLSSILPKPSPKSSKSTPASSSKKGAISKLATKVSDKRKRLEEATAAAASANNKAKKIKLGSEGEPQESEQDAKAAGPDFITGTSQSGRIRKVKKIFDL